MICLLTCTLTLEILSMLFTFFSKKAPSPNGMPYGVLFRDFSQLGMFFLLLPVLLPGGTHSSLALAGTRGTTHLNTAATWDHPGLFAHRVFAGF